MIPSGPVKVFLRPLLLGIAVGLLKRAIVDRLGQLAIHIVVGVCGRGGAVVITGEIAGPIVDEADNLDRIDMIGGRIGMD